MLVQHVCVCVCLATPPTPLVSLCCRAFKRSAEVLRACGSSGGINTKVHTLSKQEQGEEFKKNATESLKVVKLLLWGSFLSSCKQELILILWDERVSMSLSTDRTLPPPGSCTLLLEKL